MQSPIFIFMSSIKTPFLSKYLYRISNLSMSRLCSGEVHQDLGSVLFNSSIVEKSTSFFERIKVIMYKKIGRLAVCKHSVPAILMYLLAILGRYLLFSVDSATHSENLSIEREKEAVTKILKQIESPKNLVISSPCCADYGGRELVQSF